MSRGREPVNLLRFRRGIDCPREYTNTHLRRQLVMEMIRYKVFFLPHLTDAISGGYGGKLLADEYARHDKEGLLTAVVRQAYEEPGPFSYLMYLEHILKRDSWGDEITLVVLSMVFQLRINRSDCSKPPRRSHPQHQHT